MKSLSRFWLKPVYQGLVDKRYTVVFDYVFEDMRILPRTGKMGAI